MRKNKESLRAQALKSALKHTGSFMEKQSIGLFKVSSGSMLSMQVGCDVP